MRAAVFVRYRSGDEMGHVGWAFEAGPGAEANAGSVENHGGRFISSSQSDGFWSVFSRDPAEQMRRRKYDDVKYVDLAEGDPVSAYRVVLWIHHQAYRAAFRNCEDDVYDVLRAYGVRGLPAPALHWLPNRWFETFKGTHARLAEFRWDASSTAGSDAGTLNEPARALLTPLRPSWRRPTHPDFHVLYARRLLGRLTARRA